MFGGGGGGGAANSLGANPLFGLASAEVSEVPSTSQMAMIPIVNPPQPHLEEDKDDGAAGNDVTNQSNARGNNGETGEEQPLRAPNVITNADD